MPAIDAIVLDFETSNPCRGSLCAIGGSRIAGGKVVGSYHQLVRPPAPYDAFHRRNIDVHGIWPEHIADAPPFAQVAPQLARMLAENLVVGHGVLSADLPMADQALRAAGLRMPPVDYVCTVAMSRQLMPGLDSYRLPDLVRHVLGREMVGHHDAGQDAAATAELLLGICEATGVQDLSAFVRHRAPSRKPLPAPKPPWLAVRPRAVRP